MVKPSDGWSIYDSLMYIHCNTNLSMVNSSDGWSIFNTLMHIHCNAFDFPSGFLLICEYFLLLHFLWPILLCDILCYITYVWDIDLISEIQYTYFQIKVCNILNHHFYFLEQNNILDMCCNNSQRLFCSQKLSIWCWH